MKRVSAIVMAAALFCVLVSCEMQWNKGGVDKYGYSYYDRETTYPAGAVVDSGTGYVFTSLQDGNKGHFPPNSLSWWEEGIVVHIQ